MSETKQAVGILRGLTEIDDVTLVQIVFDGEPKTKAAGKRIDSREKELSSLMRRSISKQFNRSVAVAAVFYRPNYQRIDVDNMMKLVLDAGTKARVWRDDSYVIAQGCRVELDHDHPRTVIAICAAKTTFDRDFSFTCKVCEKPFKRAGVATFKRRPLTCSRKCRYALANQGMRTARCAKCGTEFIRKVAGQRYCSRKCYNSTPRVRMSRDQQNPWPTCLSCGGRVSRREYLRCANCSPKGRKIGSKNKNSREAVRQ